MTSSPRLNPTDEMLARADRSVGSARIVQLCWQLDAMPTPAQLRDEWEALNRTRLSRVARDRRFPGARRAWEARDNRAPIRTTTAPVAQTTGAVVGWLDEQVRYPLRSDSEALWLLAAAAYGRGGIVSLTVPHCRSDGHGVFAALHARAGQVTCVEPSGTSPHSRGHDALDLARVLAGTGASMPRWMCGAVRDPSVRRALVTAAGRRSGPGPAGSVAKPAFFDSVFRVVETERWHDAAVRSGGTDNSLLVEMAANLVRASASGAAAVRVGVPTSLRGGPDDTRANALLVAPIELPGGSPQYADCRTTRAAVKAGLTATTRQGAMLVPDSAWSLLPTRWAQRFKTPGAQFTDVVASNFGTAPHAALQFAGQRTSNLLVRTMNVPGVRTDRSPLRASLCLVRVGGSYHLTVTAAPGLFGDSADLDESVDRELEAWGIGSESWPAIRERIDTG